MVAKINSKKTQSTENLQNKKVILEINKIVDLCIEIIPKKELISIYLIGSTARNEASLINTHESIDILGDYELVIVTRGIRNPWKSTLQSELGLLAKSFGSRSPLFEIDFGLVPFTKLGLIPPSLWSFEFIDCGLLLFGSEIRDKLTQVNVKNLDFGNLRWLIVVRLWSYLKNIWLISKEHLNEEQFSQHDRLLVARNLLDIPTIILPHFGILISGYTSRNEYLANLPIENLEKIGGANRYQSALKIKLNPDYETCSTNLHKGLLLESYLNLIEVLAPKLRWDRSPSNLDSFIKLCKGEDIFKLSFFKEARMMHNSINYYLKLSRSQGYFKSFKWLFSNTRYDFLGFLISYYSALSSDSVEKSQIFLNLSVTFLERARGESLETLENTEFDQKAKAISLAAYNFMINWYEKNRA